MAEGGDQLSSFIVVDVESDLKDFENEDSVYKFTKSYLEDIKRSGGGKCASGGFVKNPNSQKLQYVVHYANTKSVERVLKRPEHCIEVNRRNLVLTVRPCPPGLKKILEAESPPSDGEGEGTGNSSNGESSPVDKFQEVTGQNSSASSDIEIISHDGPNGFTYVDVNKQGSARHTGDAPAKPQTSEIQPSAIYDDPSHSSDSSPCSSPEDLDDSSVRSLDQWSRSIIIENVPENMFTTLRLQLENRSSGGGNIVTYERNPVSNHVLATFEELKAAENFLDAKKLNMMKQVFSVRRPLLREEAKDTSADDLVDKDEETTTAVPNSETKDKEAAAELVRDENEDAGLRKVHENKDGEDTEVKNRVSNEEESESKQSQEESGRNGEDDELKKEIQNEELRNEDEDRREDREKDEHEEFKAETESEEQRRDDVKTDGTVKPKDNEDDEDEQKKEDKGESDAASAAAAAKEERTRGAVDEDSSNADKSSNEHVHTVDGTQTTMSGIPQEKPTPETGKAINDEYVLLSPPLGMSPLRKDEASLKTDTSGSEPSSSLDALKTSKSIIVLGVLPQTVDTVRLFLESPDKGGGRIKDVEFSETDGELSVFFDDDQVAEKFLDLESFSILENTFHVLSPEKKKMNDTKRKSAEDSLESSLEVEEECRTLEVHGVDSLEVAEVLLAFMENKRRGGGTIESESLDENSGVFTLKFEDRKIADRFLAQNSISLVGKFYDIRAPVKEEPKTENIPPEQLEEDLFKDKEMEERSRTVEVHGVLSHDVAETVVAVLENKRRGGGTIEEEFLNESDGILTVRFQEKKYAEHFLRQEMISVVKVPYYIRPSSVFYASPGIEATADIKSPSDAETSNQKKSLYDEEEDEPKGERKPELSNYREEDKWKLNVEPINDVADNRDESEVPEDMEEHSRKLADDPVGKPQGEPRVESPVGDPRLIEVRGIPDTATDAVVTMIFENKRYCGIVDVEVDRVEMLEGGRALVTIKEPQDANALVNKGSIEYKNHTLVISRPSKPDPVEEVRDSVQRPFSYKDINETPSESATGSEQSISEAATIDVSNIPEDMDEETLRMVIENKRFVDGAEVTNVVYEKGRGSAVVTLSEPEVAKKMVQLESVGFKGWRLMITKHVAEDRSQNRFPARKRNNVPSNQMESMPLTAGQAIRVSNIPADMTEQILVMLFENKRKGGGETENIVYDERQGTAVITFKDPEVAKTLVQKEILIYKGSQLTITTAAEEEPIGGGPKEDEPIGGGPKEDEVSSVSSRMVDVSDIPPDMTTEMLTMLLENSSGGEVESIDHDQNSNIAVATFTDSVAADVLVSEESVVFKGKQFSVTRHVEKKVAEGKKHIPTEKKTQPASSDRTIFVSQIPRTLNRDFLVMLFENKRVGGGKTEDVDFNPEQGTAVVTFEDPKIAASLLKKEIVEFKGERMMVTKHEDQASDAGHGEDNEDNVSAKTILPSLKFGVSGSFNTVKVSGLKDTSKEMISMYFENSKRSGGGKLKVLDHQKEKGKAVIKFDNPEDAKEVCRRAHNLSGVTQTISALEMPLGDVKSCAIEVKGLGERATVDLLTLNFENTRRSGGGPVEKVFLNKEARTAIVVFEEATAVAGVMKKQPHTLDGASLEVNVLEAAPPPPLLLSDVDTKRLLAKRIPPSITRESLWEYLRPVAKATMVGWTLAVKPSTALLDFSSEPDYLSIRRLVCSKPFLGTMISIRRVPQTSSILITGIPSSISAEFVAMYFENPRNGGTGEECKVQMLPEKGSAIIELERPDVIHSITSKKHKFETKEVQVEPYYPWLGMISASGSGGKVPAKTNSRIPTSLTYAYDPITVDFIQKRPELQKHIEDSLEKWNCCVEWPSKGKGEVKVEYKGKEKQKPGSGWDTECTKILQRYADELTWKKENFLQEIWNDFKKEIQEHTVKKSKLLDTAFENDKCEIQYIGLKKDTDEFEELIRKIQGKLEEELKRRKERISETMTNLKPHQIALICAEEFKGRLKQKNPDIEFELKQTEVSLCGMPDVVKKAKLFIMENVAATVQDSLEASESMCRVFLKDDAKPYLLEQLHSKGISASWSCNDPSVIVYAFDNKNLKEAVDVLKREVVEVRVPLSEASETLVQSVQWKEFIESLRTDFKSLEVTIMGTTVVAACTRNIEDSVKKRLNGFIEKHAIFEKHVPMDLGYVELITNFMKDKLKKIEAGLVECSGGIGTSKGESGFVIVGNESGVGKAVNDLLKLVDNISAYDHDIDRPGIPAYFYSRPGKEVLRGIQINRSVSIQLDNTQSRAKPQAIAGDGSETCRVEVRPGKFMVVMRGDITKCHVDAIVNAANEDLKHIGGVAAAIAEAAGRELEDDCYIHIKMEGRLLPGKACITRAGKLPCKKVIHAVGPRWSGGKADEESTLALAVESSLNVANEEGLKSIAMPSISTGIFGFPLDRATDIIVDAVKSYLVENSSTTVREVFFIDNDSRAVASLDKKLRTIQIEIPNERTEGKRGRRVAERAPQNVQQPLNTRQGSPQNRQPPPNRNQGGSPATQSAGFQSAGSGVIKTVDGVRITLVKGSISELQADVLVNTTGKELNLSHGNVSKSLLAAAGPALQAEVDAKKPPNFDYGQIVVTSGGNRNLRCKYVYHGSCRQWDNGKGDCERTVRAFMKNLLERADGDKQKSIAIPAIGTGNLKIPHKIVAEIMYSEVEKFSRQRKPMNLLDIRFIVYDKDRDSVKAFEDKIKELLQGGVSSGAAAATAGSSAPPSQSASSSSASSRPSPSASSVSSSGPDFSFDPTRKVIRIGTLQMILKSGDITKERADAIVNSTNDRMDMTGGAVAKAILKAGGKVVETECRKAKMSSRKVCVTSGGNLPVNYIIHLVAGYNAGAWKEVIENALEEAEDKKCKNIVFPMLGTGQIGQSASSMASIMVDAACDFYKTKHPQSLKEITVCIFQSSMLDEFVDAVANKGASTSFMNRAAEDNAGARQRTRAVADPFQPSEEHQEERHPQHLSRIILSIYALSKKAIDDVIKDIEEVIKEYIIDKVLNSPQDQENIAKLSVEQINRIKEMTKIFPVQIEVETRHLKRIRIRGPPMEVTSVMDQVHSIFQEAHKKEIKKKEEDWFATVAHWEYEDGNGYEPYPNEINAIIEKAFRDRKPFSEWEEENAKYRLTFATMLEEFVTKSGTPPVKVRRVATEMDMPASWDTMQDGEVLKRIPLNPSDQEYKDVETAARSTAQTTINQVVKIERIQNKLLYKQYFVRKAAMDAANPGVRNEMTLWHGTSADTLDSINQTGFNRSYCGKNATYYGRGVYFAKNFNYSAQNTYSPPDATGLKHVYQCKVLTGEYALSNANMIVPPSHPGSTTKKYDSTVDNVTTPTIFVIFYDTQAFPEYLIYFK